MYSQSLPTILPEAQNSDFDCSMFFIHLWRQRRSAKASFLSPDATGSVIL
jgi:hypothetical protein